MSEEQFQKIGKAVSDPHRWEILRAVFGAPEVTCGESCVGLPISAATASHHFKELEAAGLIEVKKFGRYRKLTAKREVWSAYLRRLEQL